VSINREVDPAIKEYMRLRVDNIKRQLTVASVLAHYGIDVRAVDREFQFPCPLHGDGQDNSYSARMYPDNDNGSGGTYCFACHKSRDCVRWVQDKEGLSFGKGLSHIERSFHIKNIPRADFSFDPSKGEKAPTLGGSQAAGGAQGLQGGSNLKASVETAVETVESVLTRIVKVRPEAVGMERANRLYYALDTARFALEHDTLPPDKAKMLVGRVWEVVRNL